MRGSPNNVCSYWLFVVEIVFEWLRPSMVKRYLLTEDYLEIDVYMGSEFSIKN